MDLFYSNLGSICPLLSYCSDKSCLKYHPRCFSGVCINQLNKKCEKGDNCRLKHYELKELKGKFRQTRINGVFVFNLCPDSEKCSLPGNKCQYLHREWINKDKICIKYLDDDCEDSKCSHRHIAWDELQKKVQQQYKMYGLDPDGLCELQGCSMQCKGHSPKLEGFCTLNFKGVCNSKGKCQKIHEDWENVQNVKPEQYIIRQIPPCTRLNENNNSIIDVKFTEKLEILFNKHLLQKMSKSIKEQMIVDVLFIMDCTGSMASWIQAIKDNILSIIDKFKAVITNYMVRVAFIGYRDFCDKEDHIVYHDFTGDIEQIKNFISIQKATGGGDAAEDLSGALEKALKLDISKHPQSILCTFLLCDAPTHGKQYHNLNSDDYKDKIPDQQLENIMKKFKKLKTNNYFTCCKITTQTEKMFQIMQDNFPELEITESQSEKKIPDQILFTLITSYTKSQLNIVQQPKEQKRIRISARYIRHKAIRPVKCIRTGCPDEINYFSNFLQQMGENQISGETVLEIDAFPVPITDPNEKGKCSYIFRVFDIRNNRHLIAKLPQKLVNEVKQQGNTKLLQIDKQLKREAEQSVHVRYVSTLIAQQLANGYRRESRKLTNSPPIFYVSPIRYELHKEFYGVSSLYAETEISLTEKWEKISNNSGFLQKDKQSYGTFSHLTYEWSNSQVMVTDLQGKGGIFSDPAIQTNYDALDDLIIDNTNLSMEGMMAFMNGQHSQCNTLCQQLKLTRQQFTDTDTLETENKDTAFSNREVKETVNTKKNVPKSTEILQIQKLNLSKVNCICDICGNIFTILYTQYFNQKEEEFYCDYCLQSNEKEDVCECCGEGFKYKHLQCLRLGKIPTKCSQCYDQCNHDRQKCIYCEKNCEKRGIKNIKMLDQWQSVCQKGIEYFESLQCKQCLESFNYLEWPSLQVYSSGQYTCQACQKK